MRDVVRAVLFIAAIVLFAGGSWAAEPDVVELRVPLKARAQVDVLERNGFTVGNVDGATATVYALRERLPQLSALGFTYQEAPAPETKAIDAYHNYAALTTTLQGYAATYPNLTKLISLGKSVQGRELWALLITDNPDIDEEEPEFKYIATMHGDEPIGTELLVNLADMLLSDYGVNTELTDLVNNTALWLVPMMNPDGFELVRRYNANGLDLNRSFPTRQEITGFAFDGAPLLSDGRQPEVKAVMDWSATHSFVMSANFHSGAQVVNYLYDDDGLPSGAYAACPDDALVRVQSLEYSQHNPPMYASTSFTDGITNGTQWYVATGGMQDWNYRYLGCVEATIELNNVKKPAGSLLPNFWNDNRDSLVAYLEAVQWGIRGKVTDLATGAPVYARVLVDGNPQPVFTKKSVGDYYRMLLEGSYDITIDAPGYIPYHVKAIAVPDRGYARADAQISNGDLNNDGQINAADIQSAVNALLHRPGAPAADVNGGGLDATDLQAVVKQVTSR